MGRFAVHVVLAAVVVVQSFVSNDVHVVGENSFASPHDVLRVVSVEGIADSGQEGRGNIDTLQNHPSLWQHRDEYCCFLVYYTYEWAV